MVKSAVYRWLNLHYHLAANFCWECGGNQGSVGYRVDINIFLKEQILDWNSISIDQIKR
jgi:hypothetical protein